MEDTALTRVKIVLVEPAGALNVGAIARVMKNMGLRQLVLVNPQCDPLGEEGRKMAVHAADLLETAQVVATLPQALTGCQRAIATTARCRTLTTELEEPRTALPWLLIPSGVSALIFGPEDRGLSNTELNYAQRFVRIPSHADYPSLNLAQSVGICSYELSQAAQNTELVASPQIDVAPLDVLEQYYQQMEAVLLKMGYLYPHTASSRMQKLRRLFNRTHVSQEELAMLRGIFSQMEWALQYLPPSVSAKLDASN